MGEGDLGKGSKKVGIVATWSFTKTSDVWLVEFSTWAVSRIAIRYDTCRFYAVYIKKKQVGNSPGDQEALS